MAFDDYTKSNKHDLYLANNGKRIVTQGNPPVTTTSVGSESRLIPVTDSVMGKKNPQYRAQIRDVLSATTPCTGIKSLTTIKQHPMCEFDWTFAEGNPFYMKFVQSHVGFVFAAGNFLTDASMLSDTSSLTSVENRSIATLYTQLNGFASAVKAGEDIGEISQTIDALRRPLPGLRKLVNETFGNAKKAFSMPTSLGIAKAAADTWLQFQFGYKPLESTIASAVVGLQNRDVMANYRPFHAVAEGNLGDTQKSFAIPPPGGNIAVDLIIQRKLAYKVTYQGIWAEEVNVPKRPVDAVLGLQARDVLPTIWNLIPFSFLADYFANVGDIIGAISVPWGGVRWCNKTIRTEQSNQVDQIYQQNLSASDRNRASYQKWFPETGIITRQRTTFVRSAQSTLPLPTLELTSPLDLSWKQYANIAALTVLMGVKLAALATRSVARNPKLPEQFSSLLRDAAHSRPLKREFDAHRGLS
jgi:hypothetical protein